MEDIQIIALFFERNQSAISETAIKYGKLLFKTSNNILNSKEDARECVNDTYLAVWNAVPPTNPNPLVAFICRIARNLSLKKLRERTSAKRTATVLPLDELSEFLGTDETADSELDAKLLGEAIDSFLDTLDKESRVIFVKRYWFCDEIEEIETATGISKSNIYKKLSKTRKALKSYLEKEGVTV